jgi:cyanophycin synthetase
LARGIPVHRLNLGSFVQLGHGACQRRIHTAETDRTGAIGEEIASDKELTKELLRTVGVPVPEGRPVESAADAWEAAEEVGVPVVVKPRDGNHGRGVFTGLTTRDEVEAAYEIACQEGSGVLVERFALGSEHRLLVVDGQLAAATRGDPACVTGDGQQTIHELVESQINSDPRRGDAEEFPLARLRFDSIARLLLKQQGFTPDSVPQTDQRVIVQYNGNLSIDVTDEVHPEVAARAVDAARMVGLDVAGLDIVAQDISRPLEEQGGVIVEVNAGPGLQMHVRPSRGRPRPVGAAIVRSLFPHDPAGRIPLVGVYDDREGQPMVAAVGRWLGTDGRCAGWACHAGIFVADRRLTNAPHDERQTVDLLLANNRVEAAAVGVTSRGIISRGLAYNDAHVALVAPRAEGETYNAQRARLLGVLGRALTAGGWLVLPAEDAELIEPYGFEPSRLVLYDLVADAPALQRHRAAGRCTAILRNDQVIVATGNDEIAWTDRKNMARDVAPIDQLAATASQWVLGLLFADQFSTTAAAN